MKIVNYEESFGEVTFPEGFEEILKGLTIEQQTEHYRTTRHRSYSMTNWSERTIESGYYKLEESTDVKALIVKDGIIVGVMMLNDYGREVPCFAEQRVCTYYAEDNNGAGYKTRIDYTYLVCVPKNFEKTAMVEIKFEKDNNRAAAYYADKLIGECDFADQGEHWSINRTAVNNLYQGQGIATKLVECVMANAAENNKKLIADCSYAKKLIEK